MRVSLLSSAQEAKLKTVPYASLRRRLEVHTFAMAPCATDRKRFIYGTRFPSVVSSASYTADFRHSFFKELQGIGALYQAETTDRWFRVTKDVPVLRVNYVTVESVLPRVWETVCHRVKRCDQIKL